jgi:hypothetical protein
VEQRPQAHLAVVDERAAVGRKRPRGRVVARAVATRTSEVALLAPVTIDARLDVEERDRIEVIGLLAAAADVAHRRAQTENDGENHGGGVAATLLVRDMASKLQGSTS